MRRKGDWYDELGETPVFGENRVSEVDTNDLAQLIGLAEEAV